MDTLTDYANWKVENFDLLNTLIQNDSKAIRRFKIIFTVLDYLYDEVVNNNKKLDDNEEYIFEIGFEYVFDRFFTIKTIYESSCKNDYIILENLGKTINLLLFVMDLEDEVLNSTKNYESYLKDLEKFENKLLELIDKGLNVDDAYFSLIDEVSTKIFAELKIDFTPVEAIFHEIAELYHIDDEYEDIYNDFINEKIEHEHHHHH